MVSNILSPKEIESRESVCRISNIYLAMNDPPMNCLRDEGGLGAAEKPIPNEIPPPPPPCPCPCRPRFGLGRSQLRENEGRIG